MNDYRKQLIEQINEILKECSVETLEYLKQFSKDAHENWDS